MLEVWPAGSGERVSRKPPLLYGPDGNSSLVADDSEDKLRALCLAAFGALKGLAKDANGRTGFAEGEQLERWRSMVANKITEALGQERVEAYWGVKLARGPVANLGKGSEAVS